MRGGMVCCRIEEEAGDDGMEGKAEDVRPCGSNDEIFYFFIKIP